MARLWGVVPAEIRERVTLADWREMVAVLESEADAQRAARKRR